MTGWNLPDGCTDRMVDEAFGYSSGPRGVYRVLVKRYVMAEIWIEVEASSKEDAETDALVEAKRTPLADPQWSLEQDDYEVENIEEPDDEPDPDDARDARADYEFERDR